MYIVGYTVGNFVLMRRVLRCYLGNSTPLSKSLVTWLTSWLYAARGALVFVKNNAFSMFLVKKYRIHVLRRRVIAEKYIAPNEKFEYSYLLFTKYLVIRMQFLNTLSLLFRNGGLFLWCPKWVKTNDSVRTLNK